MTLDTDARILEPETPAAEPKSCRIDAQGDCLDACQRAYDACIAGAGSDMEKAVCNTAHTKCVANC